MTTTTQPITWWPVAPERAETNRERILRALREADSVVPLCREEFYGEPYSKPDFTPCRECYEPLHQGACEEQHMAEHCRVASYHDAQALAAWRRSTEGWEPPHAP